LSYLDRTGLIVPRKFGNPKHPKVVYRWEQVLEIKTIERLREKLSLQEIRRVIEFLRAKNHKPSLFAHSLVFVNSQLYLIEDVKDFGLTVLEASGKNKGQVVIREVGPVGDVITELYREAEKHQVLDFDKRTRLEAINPVDKLVTN
jgi:DNA-binding transcriptional MerR regulator